MYEYSIEVMDVPYKMFKQKLNKKELDELIDLINKKAEDGWELVTHTFMGGDDMWTQCFLCTFRREKK